MARAWLFALLLVPAVALGAVVAPPTAKVALGQPVMPASVAPSTNVRVTTSNGPANEVMLAVDPTDARHIIATAKDYTLTATTPQRCDVNRVWGGLYVTFDGGASWTNGLFPGGRAGDPTTAASGFGCMSDPVVVFGPDGTAHFTGLMERKALPGGAESCSVVGGFVPCLTEYALLYAKSRDGLAWTGDTLVWTGTSGLVVGDAWADKNWQAVDPGDPTRVYITWDLVAGAHTTPMLSRSADDGATWVSTPLPAEGSFPAPAVDTDGTLHVALSSVCTQPHSPPTTSCIVVLASHDHGVTFVPTDAGPIRGGASGLPYRSVTTPYIAAQAGRVYVAWADGDYVFNLPGYLGRIAVARSADHGASFTSAHLVDNAARHQLMPQVAIGGDGTVGVLYYEDDATGSHNMRARFEASHDGGATFGPSIAVSTTSFQPWASRHQNGFVFMGDYLGLGAGSDGLFHAAWTDTRNGCADVYSATFTP